MYGIFSYIWLIFMVNVGKYTIHGSFALWILADEVQIIATFFFWKKMNPGELCNIHINSGSFKSSWWNCSGNTKKHSFLKHLGEAEVGRLFGVGVFWSLIHIGWLKTKRPWLNQWRNNFGSGEYLRNFKWSVYDFPEALKIEPWKFGDSEIPIGNPSFSTGYVSFTEHIFEP